MLCGSITEVIESPDAANQILALWSNSASALVANSNHNPRESSKTPPPLPPSPESRWTARPPATLWQQPSVNDPSVLAFPSLRYGLKYAGYRHDRRICEAGRRSRADWLATLDAGLRRADVRAISPGLGRPKEMVAMLST